MKKFMLVLSVLAGFYTLLSGQTGKLFSTDNELSNSLINSLYQDNRNYVWIATEDGLNKFDGVKFTVYRNIKSDSSSLKNDFVHKLYEDTRGRFWVGCVNSLMLFDRQKDNFQEVKIYDKGQLLVPDVTSITELQSGEVWITISGNGIVRINQSQSKYEIDRELSNKLSSTSLVDVFEDSKRDIWILTSDQGLSQYSPSTKSLKHYRSPNDLGSNQISSICEDSSGNLFVGTLTSGLFKFNRISSKFSSIRYQGSDNHLPVKCLYIDSKQRILVGTDGKGMKIYQHQKNQLVDFKMESALYDLGKIKVHSLLEDRLGNFWVGIFQKGVYFNPNNPNKFNTWGYKSYNNNLIGSNCVMSVIKDKSNIMWVGTDNDGLYGVTPDKKVRHFHPNGSETSVSGTIMSVFEDSNNDIWLGSYLKGLSKLNKTSGECTYYSQVPSALGDNSLSNKVLCISEDNAKNLWIGTNGSGVYAFNLNTHTYTKHYMHVPGQSNSILNDGVYSTLIDNEGLIWVGTFRGVSIINTKTNKIENLTTEKNILPGSIIYAMLEDENGDIWIGTDEGLACYNKKTKTSQIYTIANGLSSNIICGIQQDENANIWLSTHLGISKLLVDEDRFVNYYTSDGLQGNEFSRGASFKATNGEIFFGGVSGITNFFPNQITNTRKKLDVYLTELDIMDTPVRTGQKSGKHTIINQFISDVKTIKLSHADNMISLEFSTFNFGDTKRLYYRYKLEGLNSQWLNTTVGSNRISFTNLNYGEYKLRVIACENENISDEKVIEIIIYPPWYLTIIAKILYFIFIIGLIFVFYRFVSDRIQHRHELMRREHLEQVNEGRLQFFINISHEIRTPMTLIISPLEKLMKDTSNPERTQAYQLMYRNAQRILRLINQLLDLRKIDKRMMFVKMSKTDIVDFVKDVIKIFEYQANKRNIKLQFIHEMPKLDVWVDLNNFDKVLVNILSNAFKFTPDGGDIVVNLRTGSDEDESSALKQYFEIVVSDTGIGIEENKIERIFERFYQIDNSMTQVNFGTGIGLHLAKNLVELMHGEIFARNKSDGQGSEFVVRLPLGNAHLSVSEQEFDDTVASQPQHSVERFYETNEDMEVKKSKPKTKYRILIVEDEVEIRHYLHNELADTYRISECANGKEALDFILREKPDLVISDVMMPEMDGITLCKKLKANININHIPIILLTAKSADEDKAEGFEIGADAYVSKPFNVDLLKKRIANILENRERLEHKAMDDDENKALIKPVVLKANDQILLEKIIKIINENISESELNVEMLADGVGMSRVHMHRKLKELTNMSARDFIRSIRLKQAADLLSNQKLTVSEVCYALGFSNLSHFSNSFREFFGMSPKEYAEKHRNIP